MSVSTLGVTCRRGTRVAREAPSSITNRPPVVPTASSSPSGVHAADWANPAGSRFDRLPRTTVPASGSTRSTSGPTSSAAASPSGATSTSDVPKPERLQLSSSAVEVSMRSRRSTTPQPPAPRTTARSPDGALSTAYTGQGVSTTPRTCAGRGVPGDDIAAVRHLPGEALGVLLDAGQRERAVGGEVGGRGLAQAVEPGEGKPFAATVVVAEEVRRVDGDVTAIGPDRGVGVGGALARPWTVAASPRGDDAAASGQVEPDGRAVQPGGPRQVMTRACEDARVDRPTVPGERGDGCRRTPVTQAALARPRPAAGGARRARNAPS